MKPQYTRAQVPQFSISMYPFSVAHYFRRYLNFFQIRINKMVNSITTLALQDQSQGYILSYFFKVLRVLPLSRMLVQFSLKTCIFHHVWETFEKKHWIYKFLLMLPPLSTPPPTTSQSKLAPKSIKKIWRWLGTFGYLYFSWFEIFSNVMTLRFCRL